MTQSMRIHFAKKGIRVVEILYPEVDTPFSEGRATKNAISPQLAASEALKELNSGREEIHVKRSKMIYTISRLMPKRGLKILNSGISKEIETILRER